jgi:Ca-activated chloride channel family protein
MSSIHEILFYFPKVGFLIFLLIPFFVGQLALTRYRQKQQLAYASSRLLPRLIIPRSSLLRITKIGGWALIWTLACLALMEPFGNIRYSSLSPQSSALHATSSRNAPHEIIFLVDTSASMRVPDGPDGQTRLEAAKAIMEDILRQLHGQTVSLYAFTSELSALVPPTLDYIFTRLVIKDLQIDQSGVGGTRFASVLIALRKQAFPEPSPKHYTIIMLTDGGDTQLETLKGAAREQERQAILTAISDPEQLHVQLFTVGLGSLQAQPIPDVTLEGKPVLSKLEPEILEQLAVHERGKYYRAEEWTSQDLARELMTQMEENDLTSAKRLSAERKVTPIKKEDVIVDLYYQIPLGLALLFYFLNLLLPDVRRL